MTAIYRSAWCAGSTYEWPTLCRATEALLEPLDTPIFSPGCHALVDVEEHRQRPVTRPALADDRIDPLPQPPRARSMAQVMTAQSREFGLAGIVRWEVGPAREQLGAGRLPHVEGEPALVEGFPVAVEDEPSRRRRPRMVLSPE
jgi:hypothetical protein